MAIVGISGVCSRGREMGAGGGREGGGRGREGAGGGGRGHGLVGQLHVHAAVERRAQRRAVPREDLTAAATDQYQVSRLSSNQCQVSKLSYGRTASYL